MKIVKKVFSSPKGTEVYISASPQPNMPVEKQAEDVFRSVKEIVKELGVRIFQERVFASEEAMPAILKVRKSIYGDLDDGVEPGWLVVEEGMFGKMSGVVVYAVSSDLKPEVLRIENTAYGRMFHQNDKMYIGLSGLSGDKSADASSQTQEMFEKAALALSQAGGSMKSIVRTWVWIKDILSWYDDFNKVRTNFFRKHGIINNSGGYNLPASTGIGIGPAGGAKCALDVFAVVNDKISIEHLVGGGEQGSAFDYGSAFSRASSSVTPAGKTVFISGTAAVSLSGETEHVGDIDAQVDATMAHARAILSDMGCTEDDIVQSIVYSKTREVEQVFNKKYGDLSWPRIMVIGDICRDDLLFEIEVTAFLK